MKKALSKQYFDTDKQKYPGLPEVSDLTANVREDSRPYYVSCSICRGHNNIITFKQKYVCLKCVQLIRSRN